MRPIRWTAPAVGLALILSLTTPSAGASPPASTPSPASPSKASDTAGGTRITLITGDHVRVTRRSGHPDQILFEPARGSGSTSAVTTFTAGHTVVIPSAARDDVLSGRLDSALFDVTTLIAEHRDDASTATLPVIVRYAGDAATALGRAKKNGVPAAAKTRLLASLGARAVAVRKNSAGQFWESLTPGATDRVASTIQRVSLDRQYKASLDKSVPQIGGPEAWQRGLTGKGVKIAILDTGLDTGEHPPHADLAGRIEESANFSESPDTADRVGHGTHVASIAAGTGAASGGKYKGVAPEATLLNVKVLDDWGFGNTSGIIAGMEWAAAQGATVANLSLGGGPTDGTDELSVAVNRITRDTGMLMVIAAGNCYGTEPGQVSSPAAADAALAVGNMERDGSMNDSSCRGPRKGDGALKPEISAPGTDIVAARSVGTAIGIPVDDFYTTLTGTSMATPHVAGTAALIAQAHPDWTAEQLKNRLVSTADPQDGSRVDVQGAGRVDADQATDGSATVDTGTLDLGLLKWPYPATDLVSRELTYRNPTGTPVTLQLAATLDPVRATPKLSATQLVVPAHGEAKVTMTADRAAAGAGAFSGRITATAAGADPLVTIIGWFAEEELYPLTIKGILRDGNSPNADVIVTRLDGPPLDLGPFGLPMRNGTATVRVPPGRYTATSTFFDVATDTKRAQSSLVTSPETSVSAATTITLDARRAAPVSLSVRGHNEVVPQHSDLINVRENTDGTIIESVQLSATGSTSDLFATPTPTATTGTSEFSTATRLELPPYQARSLGAGGAVVPVHDFTYGPRFTGTLTLPVVDAGTATPAELTGVAGKLALIRWTGDALNGDLVTAAQKAGAAAAILYDPSVAGPRSNRYAVSPVNESTIPAMRTTRVVAQHLLDQLKNEPVQVRVTGIAASPVVYDLMVPWQNRVPADARVVVDPSRLARVDETFASQVPDNNIVEFRVGTTPGHASSSAWSYPFKAPAHRTSYLLANEVEWAAEVIQGSGDRSAYFELMSTQHRYQAGTRSAMAWTTPVANSGLPALDTSGTGVRQADGRLSVYLSPFSHGPDQWTRAFGQFDQQRLTVDRNGTQVADTVEGAATEIEAPAEAADYRISLDSLREFEDWKYSTRVQSVWTFRSSGKTEEAMPLVLADIGIPQADDLNQVLTGKPVTITLDLRHQAGSEASAFTGASLEISTDATTWSTLPLTKVAEGRYQATVDHPTSEAGTSPSLRLTARDAAGSKLEQEVTKAYGLK